MFAGRRATELVRGQEGGEGVVICAGWGVPIEAAGI
jgi:hypothetical protein